MKNVKNLPHYRPTSLRSFENSIIKLAPVHRRIELKRIFNQARPRRACTYTKKYKKLHKLILWH